MSQATHAERSHALLSASKAAQWINCPPSARLQEGVPDRRSPDAERGTCAHELAEVKLRQRLTVCDAQMRDELDARLKTIQANEFYDKEMEETIQTYVTFVEEEFLRAKSRSVDAVLLLEEQLDFSEWVPEGYGTGDVIIIADGTLTVIDLKYGVGVPVSAVGNPQIRLYGLGAWAAYNWLYDIQEVRLVIAQVRLDRITEDTVSVQELLEWADNVVKPAAALAFAGEGNFKPGEHCRWCKVKATCRARAEENMKTLTYEFRDPALLSDEEIGSILFVAQQLKEWAKDVEEYAFEQAKQGHRIPQWKLVEGRSNRKITDATEATRRLVDAGYDPDTIAPRSLLGVGKLEKLLGKGRLQDLLHDIVDKPPGAPTLVPETDPRPELNSIADDFADEHFDA
ncbi:hypothetical protein Alches_17470 [Alicyclobacillus hesperidum subsp. aegles]|uniref:DUF2800 domain-containing protein n=1 Tax=Alicyclobacillus hesperidum TaxID=89784 RepID=UPI002228BE35|nr:DUF2800 domain-containing protein [Alicyclobacillus hesperidum]GLG01707.1 hypothetical protein Alches_17470 [Alicyclobacillus hesperidum subsp. aegles]